MPSSHPDNASTPQTPQPACATRDIAVGRVLTVAGMMAAMAGYINSLMLIEFGLPVSQMTGIASHLSDSGFHFEWSAFGLSAALLLSFIFGAFLSALIIGHSQYKEDRRYGYALLLNTLILILAAVMASFVNLLALIFAALACGLQNAMVASYKGLQIRTTHVTGITTDIGVSLANRLRNRTQFTWQTGLLFTLLFSFILGGLLGILAFQWFHYEALMAPALLNGVLALLYFRRFQQSLNPS